MWAGTKGVETQNPTQPTKQKQLSIDATSRIYIESTIVKGCARITGFYVSTNVDTDTIAPYDGQTVAWRADKYNRSQGNKLAIIYHHLNLVTII